MLTLSQFINQYLFDPDSGYYKTLNPIGKQQDFITAPEISSVFGELTALYLLQVTAEKKNIAFVEMGAGHGTWFLDILQAIHKLADKEIDVAQDFLQKASLHIIEISNILRDLQQQKLKDLDISWHHDFDEFLKNKKSDEEIIFISNELFDCFAIDQYVKTDIGWCQRLVKIDDKKLEIKLANFDPEINDFVRDKLKFIQAKEAPISSIFEFSQQASDLAQHLFLALRKYGGIALNIDYGYDNIEFANSLQAVSQHQKVSFSNILSQNSKCDITAHVNFAMLDNIAKQFKLNSSLVSQRDFLISLGILTRKEQILKQDDVGSDKVEKAINRLINLDEMGDLFKVHIVWN